MGIRVRDPSLRLSSSGEGRSPQRVRSRRLKTERKRLQGLPVPQTSRTPERLRENVLLRSAKRFQGKQEQFISTLPASQQTFLRDINFNTRPLFIRPGSARAQEFRVGNFPETAGFALRPREQAAQTRTGFVLPKTGMRLPRLTSDLAAHEVTHQVLAPQGLSFDQEHAVIRQRFPEGEKRLKTGSPKGRSPRPGPRQQGFQTRQLVKAAVSGSPAQQKRSRTQMMRLGRRLRGRVDF